MSREDGTQAEDRGRTEAPTGIQAVVSDKVAVPEKAVAIDGKMKLPAACCGVSKRNCAVAIPT
ncbi:MAG: hypothetical protein JRF62_01995 [Deltaproteobacteria bacterium]|nr:hypothetical protein [Deltaproteobacteria bacterium]MBW2639089.1 hypothetical protein [Deltaproteobacteria bacterium]MBW2679169.1 hypothetical protein [Deltaproteobacteria bacterium]